MSLFFISVLVICLVMAGMAVGVMNGRPPIKGSCGGMGALGIDTACVMGGHLTAYILPEKRFVQVKARRRYYP